mgnify:CR=1 FL=1
MINYRILNIFAFLKVVLLNIIIVILKNKTEAAEMGVSRSLAGYTILDKMENQLIKKKFKIRNTTEEITE